MAGGDEDPRAAFARRDSDGSRRAHLAEKAKRMVRSESSSGDAAPELHAHADAGELVKSLVYGGLDGVVTTFAIVAAVAGAGLPSRTVVLMGAANLVADGLSMGLGDYISECAEQRFAQHEFEREQWEFEHFEEGEIDEMIDLYVREKGFDRQDAELVWRTMAKYPDAFVRSMCVDELGFIAPSGDECPAWKKGLVTMASFVTFGAVPVLVYVLLAEMAASSSSRGVVPVVEFLAGDEAKFYVAAVATAVTMFALGVTKASFTRQPKLRAGAVMLLNGSAAAMAAYLIGALLESSYSSVPGGGSAAPSPSWCRGSSDSGGLSQYAAGGVCADGLPGPHHLAVA